MSSIDLTEIAAQLNRKAKDLSLRERIGLVPEALPGRTVFTTSFGLEDQAITHAIHEAKAATIALATLDTGRLFPETYALWAETERKYGLRIEFFAPRGEELEALLAKDGPDGFYNSIEARKSCCAVRKVEPLARALSGATVWITGLRGDQSNARATVSFAEIDTARNLLKINPLFDWSRERLMEFVETAKVPVNPLHAKGFLSIGCQPCTRAVQKGETERAGRWWWENEAQKECGLHVNADGKLARAPAPDKTPEAFR